MAFLEREGIGIGTAPPNRRIITGDPSGVRIALESVAAEYGAEEVFVVNIMHDHRARGHSYELIARSLEVCAQ